eukprot:scaffold95112_cov23-Cyclotella_meneghiniana.AAC.1
MLSHLRILRSKSSRLSARPIHKHSSSAACASYLLLNNPSWNDHKNNNNLMGNVVSNNHHHRYDTTFKRCVSVLPSSTTDESTQRQRSDSTIYFIESRL